MYAFCLHSVGVELKASICFWILVEQSSHLQKVCRNGRVCPEGSSGHQEVDRTFGYVIGIDSSGAERHDPVTAFDVRHSWLIIERATAPCLGILSPKSVRFVQLGAAICRPQFETTSKHSLSRTSFWKICNPATVPFRS